MATNKKVSEHKQWAIKIINRVIAGEKIVYSAEKLAYECLTEAGIALPETYLGRFYNL